MLRKHIVGSLGLKLVNTFIGFFAVPLYLSYLTQSGYGIWLTVNGAVQWFGIMDLGLGNGLRNRLAESWAKGESHEAQSYFSTATVLISGIALFLLGAFLLVFPHVNWAHLFNAPEKWAGQTRILVLLVFIFFCVQLVMQLIKMAVMADQRPTLNQLMNTGASVAGLVAVIWLKETTAPSLVKLALWTTSWNALIPLVAGIILFSGRYRKIRPALKAVDFSQTHSLLSLGFRFFIMQIAAMVVMMTDNFIITRICGPNEVPPYNIAYRYFGVILMIFNLATAPYWSAFTEAYVQGDKEWISQQVKKVMRWWMGVAALIFVMWWISDWVYAVWLQNQLVIPDTISALMALFVLANTAASIYGNFVSGAGKVQIAYYHAIFVMIINIPLSIWFAGPLGMGPAGVILANLLGSLPRVVLLPSQYRKLMRGTARGLWNR